VEITERVTIGRYDHPEPPPLTRRIEDRQHLPRALAMTATRSDSAARTSGGASAGAQNRQTRPAPATAPMLLQLSFDQPQVPQIEMVGRAQVAQRTRQPAPSRRTRSHARLISRGSCLGSFSSPAMAVSRSDFPSPTICKADIAQRANVVVDSRHRLQAAELAGQGPDHLRTAAKSQSFAKKLGRGFVATSIPCS